MDVFPGGKTLGILKMKGMIYNREKPRTDDKQNLLTILGETMSTGQENVCNNGTYGTKVCEIMSRRSVEKISLNSEKRTDQET